MQYQILKSLHHKNGMTDNKENYLQDIGNNKVKIYGLVQQIGFPFYVKQLKKS